MIGQNTKIGRPEFLTGRGTSALEQLKGRSLRKSYGGLKIAGSDVTIESVAPDLFSMAPENLKINHPCDYVRSQSLRVWGRIKRAEEPHLLAKVKIHLVNAEGAVRIGKFTLGDVLASHERTGAFLEAICNHDEDGEPCANIFELTEMLDLPEAAGPHLMLIESIRLAPLLSGIGLVKRLIKKLAIHFAPGGGVVIMPTNITGIQSKMSGRQLVFLSPKTNVEKTGLQEHPGNKAYQVGDLGQIAVMP